MAAWGFRYKTAGLVWVKVAQKQGRARAKMAGARDVRRVQEISPLVDGLAMPRLAWGMGHWSRANTEFCLLGTRGRPRTRSHSIHQVIHAPPAEHSAKPPIARTLIAALAAAPRIELFARGQTPRGWHAWGNQAEGDRVLPPSALAR
jgi:N6-adenosine-specific RNA methylase IME4